MGARRKTRGQIIKEAGEEDIVFSLPEEGGPVLSGDGSEDVICARCDKTLLWGVSRADACSAIKDALNSGPGPTLVATGTAAENRPFPFVIQCSCGGLNRIWPIIPG
jgi:hypothetical protein